MNPTPEPIRLESFDEIPDFFEPQSGRYLIRNPSGRWLPLAESDFKRRLRARGYKPKPDPGNLLSDIDTVILDVQNHYDVSYYGVICGQAAGLLETNGKRILVTEGVQLPQPAPGEWGNLRAVLEGLLRDHEDEQIGTHQLDTFHGWIKSSTEAIRAGKIQQQQALAICGPPRCGKSFLQTLITDMLTGRAAKAERYFSGKTPFNSDLYAAEHLILEDEHCSTRIDHRLKLGAAIKQHTVSTRLSSLHAKGRAAINVQAWWRVTISLNDDPEAMMVLPPLDQHIADKIILLRASNFEWPMAMETTDDRDHFYLQVKSEIGAYLHWLTNEWQMPPSVVEPLRYNVATFHHPDLAEALHFTSPEAELEELMINAYSKDASGVENLELSAEEIEKELRFHDRFRAERLFTYRNSCGTFLGRLAKKRPDHLSSRRDGKSRWWVFRPEFFK